MSNTSLLGSFGGQAGDALMFRNRIINGDMRIDQRGVALANANGYVVDRFSAGYYGGATGRFSAERSATVPAGFTNSFLLTTTTAQAVLGANDGFAIRQAIEGFNVADLSFGQSNAQTVTVSFWVRSSQTGTFSVMLLNSAGNRCYGALVTVNAVDTFEYKTVTILGDTSGTWLQDNGIGIQMYFGLGAGSSRTVAAGWSSGAGGATPGAVTGQTINICASVGANIRITGVQLEAGPTATPFERRPYSVELGMAKRYYEKIPYGAHFVAARANGGQATIAVSLPQVLDKRTTVPSIQVAGGGVELPDSNTRTVSAQTQVYSNGFVVLSISSAITGNLPVSCFLDTIQINAEL